MIDLLNAIDVYFEDGRGGRRVNDFSKESEILTTSYLIFIFPEPKLVSDGLV